MITDLVVNGVSLASIGATIMEKSIGVAEPKISYIDVPGRDGSIDVTDFVGLKFNDRSITAKLFVYDRDMFSGVRSYFEGLNGSNVSISFSDEPNIAWSGRLSLVGFSTMDMGRMICEVNVSMKAKPFPINTLTGEEVRGYVPNYS